MEFKIEDTGVWVKFIQDVLNEAAPLNDAESGDFLRILKIDGIYNSLVESYVKAFQRENDLKIDGCVNKETLEFMVKNFGGQFRILQLRLMEGEK